jgi:hypothetical protein
MTGTTRPQLPLARFAAHGTSILVAGSLACASASSNTFTTGDGGSDALHIVAEAGPQHLYFAEGGASCSNGSSTSLQGTVYDPAGKNPVYNVVVYVPQGEVSPFHTGASCDSCDSLYTGGVVTSTTTAADGTFTLRNVPSGREIPLIVQIGKWRRQFRLNVPPCVETNIPDGALTLPSNHTVGDIPRIAISIGGADTLECLFRRMGLDASEYGPGGNDTLGHIQIFNGAGAQAATIPAAPNSYRALWNSAANLEKYDIVLLSCEGNPEGAANVDASDLQALADFTSNGGRVFAEHYHRSWLLNGPFASDNLTDWDLRFDAFTLPLSAGDVITSFPKGEAFQEWLTRVDALSGIGGTLPIKQARFDQFVTPANTPSQAWISVAPGTPGGVAGASEYFSFNTPVMAPTANQCGRLVFSDLHVAGAVEPPDYSFVEEPTTPENCTLADLTPQEKVLEFMLFDISSCVTPDGEPPPPPPK